MGGLRHLRRSRRPEVDALLTARLGLFLVPLGACAAPVEPPPEGPAPTGTLVYVQEQGGNAQVVARTFPAGAERALGRNPGTAFPAAADPRGTHTLVLGVEDSATGHVETLYRVPLAIGRAESLGVSAQFVRNPVWTPDGSAVIVESSAGSFRDLYRVPREGGPPVRLTDAPHGSFEPAVAPDGATLLYVSSRDGNAELYRQPLEGGVATRLTADPGDDRRPAWRPDGARFAWLATREGHSRVWTAAADGTDTLPLRPGISEDLDFAWSPDGRALAVVTQVAADQIDLVVIDAVRGVQLGNLASPGVDENPAWSPDGRWVAFASTRDGDPELYLAHSDGTALRRLTNREGPDWLPRWVK